MKRAVPIIAALACSAGAGYARPRQLPTIHVTDRDVDRTIRVAVGQPVAVSVGAAADGGFAWQLFRRPGLVQVGKIVTVTPPAGPVPMVGRPATQIVTVKAVRPGTYGVDLWEGRPWEKGIPPLRTLSFTIIAR